MSVTELRDDVAPVAHRVPDGREHAVAEEQPDRRETQPAMGDRQAVHPEDLVEPRAARHEDELDEREIGAEQGRDLADRG